MLFFHTNLITRGFLCFLSFGYPKNKSYRSSPFPIPVLQTLRVVDLLNEIWCLTSRSTVKVFGWLDPVRSKTELTLVNACGRDTTRNFMFPLYEHTTTNMFREVKGFFLNRKSRTSRRRAMIWISETLMTWVHYWVLGGHILYRTGRNRGEREKIVKKRRK